MDQFPTDPTIGPVRAGGVTRAPARVGSVQTETLPDSTLHQRWMLKYQRQVAERPVAAQLLLPSGAIVKAVRMPMRALFEQGKIPDSITPMAQQWVDQLESLSPERDADKQAASAQQAVLDKFQEDPVAAATLWMEFLREIWVSIVVAPRFASPPKDQTDPAAVDGWERQVIDNGIFPVSSVEFDDLLYLFQWAEGVDESVEAFFQRQTEAVGAMGDVPGVLVPTEGPVGDQPAGGRVAGVSDRPSYVDLGQSDPGPDRRDRGEAAWPTGQEGPSDQDGAQVQHPADIGDARRRSNRAARPGRPPGRPARNAR